MTSAVAKRVLEKFLPAVEKWDGQTPSFREVLITADQFARALNPRGDFVKDLAGEAQVAPSAVRGWLNGTSSPNPHVQSHILKKMVTKLLAKAACVRV